MIWTGLLLITGLVDAAPGTPALPCTVDVQVLSSAHASTAQLSGPAPRRLRAKGDQLFVDGKRRRKPFRTAEGEWVVHVPRRKPASYVGALTVRAHQGALLIVVRMPLETYVGQVVAAEMRGGTPAEALRAQAVATRSYAVASPRRHAHARLCDQAHCQVVATPATVRKQHLTASRAAALDTAGKVLVLPAGKVAETPFHASCGGHTGDPVEIFGGTTTGARAQADDACPPTPWRARLPRKQVQKSVDTVFLRKRVPLGALVLEAGQGGHLRRVVQVENGRWVRGDQFSRRLDSAAGNGVVRSGRFQWQVHKDVVALSGSGHGHGVGMCQAGAFARAEGGATHGEILQHYYPDAALTDGEPQCKSPQ